jgi:hypothetical protein
MRQVAEPAMARPIQNRHSMTLIAPARRPKSIQ